MPISRFAQNGDRGDVEVMWYSHRDKWDHVGDFGGMVLPLEKAPEYVVSDAPDCFETAFLMLGKSRL